MTMRHAELVLAQLDPAADLDDHSTDRAAVLESILAAPPPSSSRRRPAPRRRLVLVGAAVMVAAAGAALAVPAFRPDATPVYAATPPQLRYERLANAPAAAELLRTIAAAAEKSTTKGSGGYGYISTKDWLLANAYLSDRHRELSVDPSETQLWVKTSDGSARVVSKTFGPQGTVNDETEPAGWETGYVCWNATTAPPLICPVDRLTDPAVLRDVLFISKNFMGVNQTGVLSPLSATSELAHHVVLPPAVRAALWRVLADLPGIAYTGRVADRAGRTGEAFSLDFNAQTGPVRDTLIVNPATGELLGYERTLLKLTNPDYLSTWVPGVQPAPLRIRTPAVVDYSVFLATELRATAG
jgi:hypothetical protein